MSKEYRPRAVLFPAVTGTGIVLSSLTAPPPSRPSLSAHAAFPTSSRARATAATAEYRKHLPNRVHRRLSSRSICSSHSDVFSNRNGASDRGHLSALPWHVPAPEDSAGGADALRPIEWGGPYD